MIVQFSLAAVHQITQLAKDRGAGWLIVILLAFIPGYGALISLLGLIFIVGFDLYSRRVGRSRKWVRIAWVLAVAVPILNVALLLSFGTLGFKYYVDSNWETAMEAQVAKIHAEKDALPKDIPIDDALLRRWESQEAMIRYEAEERFLSQVNTVAGVASVAALLATFAAYALLRERLPR